MKLNSSQEHPDTATPVAANLLASSKERRFLRKMVCFVSLFFAINIIAVTLQRSLPRTQAQNNTPSITLVAGNFSHDETVTIYGSGFGTKPQAAPVLWDTFENGALDSPIDNQSAIIGSWDADALDDGTPRYSDTISYAGNQSSYHQFNSPDIWNISLAKNIEFSRLYMDYWMHVDYLDTKSRNWKPWRFYGDADSMQMFWAWLCNDQLLEIQHDPPVLHIAAWGEETYVDQGWYHVQLTFAESSPSQSDGTVRHFINYTVHGWDSDSVTTRINDKHFDQIRIGHYWDSDPGVDCPSNSGADIYVDDVYLDTSWARVGISGAPTYSTTTHSEMQIPSAWANNSITVTVNQGAFNEGDTVYLYVFDASGDVNSNGYPLVIGEGSNAIYLPNMINN